MKDMTAAYDHDRFFISHINKEFGWEIGDRECDHTQVAVCSNRAKAIRVWRALIALDGDAQPDAMRTIELDSLRTALAESECAIANLQTTLTHARWDLREAREALETMTAALRKIDLGDEPPCLKPATRTRGKKAVRA